MENVRVGGIASLALVLTLLCSCQPAGGLKSYAVRSSDPTERVREISAAQLKDWTAAGRAFTLIDVREDDEWRAGHASTAIHISRWTIYDRLEAAVPDKSALIVLYCLSGARSAICVGSAQKLGYKNVYSLAGGFRQYRLAGLPVSPAPRTGTGRTGA